jgi:hypothetical protein
MKNDPLEWMIFENTYEAIVEEPVFEVVQRAIYIYYLFPLAEI